MHLHWCKITKRQSPSSSFILLLYFHPFPYWQGQSVMPGALSLIGRICKPLHYGATCLSLVYIHICILISNVLLHSHWSHLAFGGLPVFHASLKSVNIKFPFLSAASKTHTYQGAPLIHTSLSSDVICGSMCNRLVWGLWYRQTPETSNFY